MMSDPGQTSGAGDNPMWVNWVVLGAIVACVYLVFRFHLFGGPDATQHPAVARPLPIMELKGLVNTDEEETVRLRDIDGRVVLVSFWAPWSPVCQEQIPDLASLEEELSSRPDFRVLVVACGRPDAREDLKQLKTATEAAVAQLGVTLPIYADPNRGTRSGFDAIRSLDSGPARLVYPTTFLLDRKGFIRGVWEGCRRDFREQMRRAAAELLKE